MRALVAGGLIALAWASVGTAIAADPDRASVLRAQAHALGLDGKYEQALPLLDQAVTLDPDDQRANALIVKCLMRLERYEEAEARLAGPLAADPIPGQARLDLVAIRYHARDIKGAAEALEAARPYHASEPEFQLYDGMILLDRGQYEDAARELQRSRQNGSGSVEPVASFHEALAWAHAREGEKEREALRRVTAIDPNSVWAERASRRLDGRGTSRVSGDLDSWFDITVGGEWDDNVILRGDGLGAIVSPMGIADDEDARLVWSARYGREMFRTNDWSGGFGVRYTGTSHRHLKQYDQHYPTGTFWINRRINEQLVAQIQVNGGYGWINNKSFVQDYSVTPSLYYTWKNGQQTTLFGRGYWNNFMFNPFATPLSASARDVDRDEQGGAVGLAHTVPVQSLRGSVNAGYVFYRNEADGREWDYIAHQPFVVIDSAITDRTSVSAQVSWAYRHHDRRSRYDLVADTQDRRESDVAGVVTLDHALSDQLTGTLRYRYNNHGSSSRVFDYDRSVVGAYLTYKFF